MPYLARVLGVDAWGTVALVQIVLGYFILITNWGFAWSGVRKVAAHRNNNKVLSEIFMATWTSQWLLGIISLVLLAVIVLYVPYFKKEQIFYMLGSGSIAASVMFPAWFLNGLERMKEVATIQILTRLITVPLIFIYIHVPEDAPYVIFLSTLTSIISGVLTILWIKNNIHLEWKIPSWKSVMAELKDGGIIFGSTIWISLYTTVTPMILAVLLGNTSVGYYAMADKVRLLAQSALNPILQALFPRMNHLFFNDKKAAIKLLKKIGIFIALISGIGGILIWIFSNYIIYILGGSDFNISSSVLKWMSPLPFIICVSSLASLQVLIPNKQDNKFNTVLILGGILNLIIIYPLIQYNNVVGAAQALLIVEIFVALGMWIYSYNTLKKLED